MTTAHHPGGNSVPSELRVTSQPSDGCDSSVPAGGRTLIKNVTINQHQVVYETHNTLRGTAAEALFCIIIPTLLPYYTNTNNRD